MEHPEDLEPTERGPSNECVVCGAEPGFENPDCPNCGSDLEPPEPDYDAPSLAEILEMDHRRKEELR